MPDYLVCWLCRQESKGGAQRVDLPIGTLKPLHARWILSSLDSVKNKDHSWMDGIQFSQCNNPSVSLKHLLCDTNYKSTYFWKKYMFLNISMQWIFCVGKRNAKFAKYKRTQNISCLQYLDTYRVQLVCYAEFSVPCLAGIDQSTAHKECFP